MSKLDREVVIGKLIRKGLKVKFYPNSRELSHFEARNPYIELGIRSLGYLDFIGVPVMKKKLSKSKRERKPMSINFIPPKGWSFAWFPNREDAEDWIAKQKENKWLDIRISKDTIEQTEGMEYRACLEGVMPLSLKN